MENCTTLMLVILLFTSLGLTSGSQDMGNSHTSLQNNSESLTLTLRNLTSALTEVQRDNVNLRRLLTEVQAAQLRHMMTSCGRDFPRDNATTPNSFQNTSAGGATYIRWGRTSCPPESELVYKGYIGGGTHSDSGAATNFVCLPEDPQYASATRLKDVAGLFGTEYQTGNRLFPNHDQDAPCALCRSPIRSSAVMIPARIDCYPGFHQEYYGYLMAGQWDDVAGSEYICVDRHPENVPGGVNNSTYGKRLYFTVGRCGSLKCPPYQEERVITCAVCSK